MKTFGGVIAYSLMAMDYPSRGLGPPTYYRWWNEYPDDQPFRPLGCSVIILYVRLPEIVSRDMRICGFFTQSPTRLELNPGWQRCIPPRSSGTNRQMAG